MFELNRRDILRQSACGMGLLGLANVLGAGTATAQAAPASPMRATQPPFAARAKHVIHIFLNGGASQVDTFDPKPLLSRYENKSLPLESGNLKTERKTGNAFPSPFRFSRYGESGLEVSELFPHVGRCADELCVIRSMYADVPNHEPSLMLMNCGDARLTRPSMGSWVTYGLGTENENLPGFVVLCPQGMPIKDSANWRSAFLPGIYQGTYIDPENQQVDQLISNVRNPRLTTTQQQRQLELLRSFNLDHRALRREDDPLEARIQTFELAYRMQMEAADVFDLSQEPAHIHQLYGSGVHARQCLMARRLVERGVRYVQLWHGEGQPWDSHDKIESAHRKLAKECDQPIAALLTDLKQRGLLDDTLVICGGEFGRTPVVELPTPGANQGTSDGRDHNHYGFTVWLAGGGCRAGTVVGATDEFGFKAVENRVHVHDLQATVLRLLGFDHERLTYRFAGRDFRLTDVHGRVIPDLMA